MAPRPYKSASREEAAERTRVKLVAAAANLLSSAGDFSLDAVAKQAGVTRLTVYNQFGSRRALLEAVFDDRAARGGLHRIADAMADPDPQAGLRKLVAIFCDFWSYDEGGLQGLHAASGTDAEFRDSLTARNERRRKALSTLLHRMPAAARTDKATLRDLADTLFALTSLHFFSALSTHGRSKSDVCEIVRELIDGALARALPMNNLSEGSQD
ncbi:MAG TPA: TetR/AcrR family transcriptional regulator [Rhizomicrobium sp.]|nr:TetR/AcrR family transcriptional regulator [Rhizomicrobium sp.]